MIHGAFLDYDEGVWTLCLDDAMGTHRFECDPADIDKALSPWRSHIDEGALARVEAGHASWEEYQQAMGRHDPEWADSLADAADVARKQEKEAA